ncbi:BCL2 modifying factor 1 [Lates japonicus]|uniref:BCL2 modifying factor 1 n=1 Tax=Lates japonicus TaxID=270547 RepID=A0AAD3RC16_LATJO|nr:BCL2 modifying factor 1 [Lates japonicus]
MDDEEDDVFEPDPHCWLTFQEIKCETGAHRPGYWHWSKRNALMGERARPTLSYVEPRGGMEMLAQTTHQRYSQRQCCPLSRWAAWSPSLGARWGGGWETRVDRPSEDNANWGSPNCFEHEHVASPSSASAAGPEPHPVARCHSTTSCRESTTTTIAARKLSNNP